MQNNGKWQLQDYDKQRWHSDFMNIIFPLVLIIILYSESEISNGFYMYSVANISVYVTQFHLSSLI